MPVDFLIARCVLVGDCLAPTLRLTSLRSGLVFCCRFPVLALVLLMYPAVFLFVVLIGELLVVLAAFVLGSVKDFSTDGELTDILRIG